MTERLAETTRRLENLHQLELVVTAMRGISASRAQHARAMLRGLRAHAAVIAGAIGQALALVPQEDAVATGKPRRSATILFCGEQGFAGAFSDRMLAALTPPRTTQDLFLIGTKGGVLAQERGITPAWQSAMVPHASLVAPLAGRIADALYNWVSEQESSCVDLIVPTWSAATGLSADRRSLLPFDFRRFTVAVTAQPPLITLPPEVLLARLAEEYVFSEICAAALTAFVAENEARVTAMLAAKGNLEHMGSDLRALERQIRQDEITAEVVELASGGAILPGR